MNRRQVVERPNPRIQRPVYAGLNRSAELMGAGGSTFGPRVRPAGLRCTDPLALVPAFRNVAALSLTPFVALSYATHRSLNLEQGGADGTQR